MIGREIDFSLDINLNAVPELDQNDANDALDCLKLTDSSRNFISFTLKTIMEDYQTVHAECINNSRNIVVLHAGNIAINHKSIQSDISNNNTF